MHGWARPTLIEEGGRPLTSSVWITIRIWPCILIITVAAGCSQPDSTATPIPDDDTHLLYVLTTQESAVTCLALPSRTIVAT